MKAYRIAIFCSGNGSNFQAIVNQVREGQLAISIELLVCDRPNAYVMQRAQEAGIPVLHLEPKWFSSKDAYEQAIVQALQEKQVDLLLLAGYMRLVSAVLLQAYPNRILNVHPSLLPAFPGKEAVRQAIEYGAKITGVTIHLIDEGIDTGPIVAQQSIEVFPGETIEQLTARIHQIEHHLLPKVIDWFVKNQVQILGRSIRIVNHETEV